MPIHDWTRVGAGAFHHFHLTWIAALAGWLNTGGLPPDHVGLLERTSCETESDFELAEQFRYSRLANRLTVCSGNGKRVATIEIVSPGIKGSRAAIHEFIQRTTAVLADGVHHVVIDLLPPSKYDPHGLHRAIWDELNEAEFVLPTGKSRTAVSYRAKRPPEAYVEPMGVGDSLPELPLFFAEDRYVPLPLEATYLRAWHDMPRYYRRKLEATE